ncbi:MAG: PEP-CTERM sorting domain-containing protein [Planctomycetia bacterium]|nr:PEP-CTERM sorting domain-containing protein [Planctomycetia bacterium]
MSVVDGKLTNIGADGQTHILEFYSGFFGSRGSWPDCDFPHPIYELLLGTETPEQLVNVTTWDSSCVFDPERDPLLDRHFTAGPGRLSNLGSGFKLVPQLRNDGSYRVISIDNVLVPEPSSIAILGVAITGAFITRRFRTR